MLSPFRMVCGNFILPEPASYVFFYPLFNLRKLLYIIKRPKMKLEKWDGDILSVLKRAERLLIENGQPERAKQMMEQFHTFYNLSSGVISQYVEIELPEKSPKKAKKDRGEER